MLRAPKPSSLDKDFNLIVLNTLGELMDSRAKEWKEIRTMYEQVGKSRKIKIINGTKLKFWT